jgi:hypothetical protein
MNGRSRVRTIASVFAVVLRLAFAASTTTGQTNPARLTSVDLIDTSSENIRIELTIDGEVGGVATLRLGDGRYVFDLEPIAWEGPTRRVNPHAPGIREYRYSQFSRKPLITRFVVEVDSLWSCVHTREPEGIIVACGGAPLQGPASATETIAVVRGLELSSPLTRLDAEGLIERSIGFTPQDVVRDGLPHFGSTRDDWIGKPRPHKGLDIYVDLEAVQAVAAGTVVGTGLGQRAGGWATIDHGRGVETVYVHISRLQVKKGDQVSRGQQIAFVDGAAGNAVEPQLHFELRLDGEAVDPVPYIYELAPEELRARIAREQRRLEVLERERAAQVRQSSGK